VRFGTRHRAPLCGEVRALHPWVRLDVTLLERLPGLRSPEPGIQAVHPTRKHLPPRLRALARCLAAAFAQPQAAW